jgi:hypothetical protein
LLILIKLNFWSLVLLKDTLFWFITVAIVLLFAIVKAKDSKFFKDILIDTFKWSLVIEFIINFYTFNLIIEILLVPIILILVLTQTISETDKKYNLISKFLQNILAIIGLFIIGLAVYKTFKNFKTLFQLQNLFSFLLPPILTILMIPYLYLLVVYISYDSLFSQIKHISDDLRIKRSLKRAILLNATINLNRLNRISARLNRFDLNQSTDIKTYIKKLIIRD